MRKKWTPKTEITESLVQFRQKRKWQIALRRYVLEGSLCSQYASFFGIDNQSFRKWVELQFDSETNWENFSTHWQFEHIVPVTYFDFNNDDDMRLCWNFVNIRVEKFDLNNSKGNKIDVLAARAYFKLLHEKTGYGICRQMVEKIEKIELSQIGNHEALENFITERKEYLETLASYTPYEYEKLNSGVPFDKVQWERNFLKKFE